MSDNPILTAEETLMHAEAAEAGDAVARFLAANADAVTALAAQLRAAPPRMILTCARGSSDHAATYGKYVFETLLGIPVASVSPSIASVFKVQVTAAGALCLVISQSGRSPDILATVAGLQASGAYVVALVNDLGSPLSEIADVTLGMEAGPERSVAATKSFIVSLAGIAALSAAWSGRRDLTDALAFLPAILRRAFLLAWEPVSDLLADATNLFVVGRGYSFGIAQEAALKLKETCALHAEAFSAAEVRHGPMAIVGTRFPVLAFATSDAAGDDVRTVTSHFAGRGAQVLVADPLSGPRTLPALGIHPALEPILMIASFYRMVAKLSIRRGLNPDTPPYLNKVTRTQ